MPIELVLVGLLPAAAVAWMIATRHRRGELVTASRLVTLGALIFAVEHTLFATTCAARVGCPESGSFFAGDHVRLHVFMAGVYTLVAAAALTVIAHTLVRNGRRVGWFTVLGALVVGGGLELALGGFWFDHSLRSEVTPGATTFEDFAWAVLFTYVLAWTAALGIAYRPTFRSTRTP